MGAWVPVRRKGYFPFLACIFYTLRIPRLIALLPPRWSIRLNFQPTAKSRASLNWEATKRRQARFIALMLHVGLTKSHRRVAATLLCQMAKVTELPRANLGCGFTMSVGAQANGLSRLSVQAAVEPTVAPRAPIRDESEGTNQISFNDAASSLSIGLLATTVSALTPGDAISGRTQPARHRRR